MSFPRPRPSITSLLDHTARIHRPAQFSATLGSLNQAHVLVASAVPCAVRRPQAIVVDVGPGLSPAGERDIYFELGVDLLTLDVIELVTGPDAPGTWEVNGPPTRPRDHHVEARCRHFSGTLTGS